MLSTDPCILTKKGVPCKFPFTHQGIVYNNSCAYQEKRFWYDAFYWCYTDIEGVEYSECDMDNECPELTTAASLTTLPANDVPTSQGQLYPSV